MSLDLNAVDTALTAATPILAGTVWPVLAITAGVALWLRSQDVEDNYSIDDYKPAATTHATIRRPAADDRTQIIPRILPDAGTPVFDQLAARHTARQWLRDIAATHAFVNGVNEGSVR